LLSGTTSAPTWASTPSSSRSRQRPTHRRIRCGRPVRIPRGPGSGHRGLVLAPILAVASNIHSYERVLSFLSDGRFIGRPDRRDRCSPPEWTAAVPLRRPVNGRRSRRDGRFGSRSPRSDHPTAPPSGHHHARRDPRAGSRRVGLRTTAPAAHEITDVLTDAMCRMAAHPHPPPRRRPLLPPHHRRRRTELLRRWCRMDVRGRLLGVFRVGHYRDAHGELTGPAPVWKPAPITARQAGLLLGS
jgi:hypothetical protein